MDDDNSFPATDAVNPTSLPEFAPALVEDAPITGMENIFLRRLIEARHLIGKSGGHSVQPLLPLLLELKGKPYTLQDHFPFEPLFRTRTPETTIYVTGRQVAKSTGAAARGIVLSNSIAHYTTLYIAPLYETIRRFSQNYVRPFIETSPVRALFSGSTTINSVLQRSFVNRSQMLFSFAFLDAERVRGVSADHLVVDEAQMLDRSLVPIIDETLSASKYGRRQFFGTPSTLSNGLTGMWEDSSQGEWVISCRRCRHDNVPCLTHDLDDMIGPWHKDISEAHPAIVCAKCREPVDPRFGRWIHRFPEKRWTYAGYHIPQIIMPMHYGDSRKWATLLAKRAGRNNTTTATFYNEVCGQPYDTGSRLVTLSDLRQAAVLPWPREIAEAIQHLEGYQYRILAADWGGGGKELVSFTKFAVLGILPTGKIDCLYGHQSMTPHDHPREARLTLFLLEKFKCHALAHDYTGAGSLRETFVHQAGYPLERIVPIVYQRASAGTVMKFVPATGIHPRDHWYVDKARSLMLTCNHIKNGWLRFFRDDYEDADNPGMLRDFLALIDEKINSRAGSDIFTIISAPGVSDDFAQAVNIGCCCLWHMTGKWPNVAEIAAMQISEELLSVVQPWVPDGLIDFD